MIFHLFFILVFIVTRSHGSLVTVGEYFKIYDPDPESLFYINDHTFILDSTWHLAGITHTNPADPNYEVNLAHAITNTSIINSTNFTHMPFILGAQYPETHLWAPHIIDISNYFPNGSISYRYFMVYCGGGVNRSESHIRGAYSNDLFEWIRIGTLFTDGVDARDPMLFFDNITNKFYIYYTGTRPNNVNINNVSHVVLMRESTDLLNWSNLNNTKIIFNCGFDGNNFGGSCESPFVLQRGNIYYLMTGPWNNDYTSTKMWYSNNPFNFGSVIDNTANLAGNINSHAAEMVRDSNGNWFVSSCGWSQGIYVCTLHACNTIITQLYYEFMIIY